MNTVALYDDNYEKNSIFGAYRELHKLSISEVAIASLGTILSLIYWILPKITQDLVVFGISLKVRNKGFIFVAKVYISFYFSFKLFQTWT